MNNLRVKRKKEELLKCHRKMESGREDDGGGGGERVVKPITNLFQQQSSERDLGLSFLGTCIC